MTERSAVMHATAIVLGDRGIMITGAPQSGKTTLALTLIDRAWTRREFAALVSDDAVRLEAQSGKLVATCPGPHQGLAEWSGLGLARVPFVASAVVDRIVHLEGGEIAERLPEPASRMHVGMALPHLILPVRQADRSALLIESWLGGTELVP